MKQLQVYLDHNGGQETFQSGFKTHHSPEKALHRVLNDIVHGSALGWFKVIVIGPSVLAKGW